MNVELLDIFGSDRMVVDAARVSYGKRVETFGEKDAKLIKYLAEHKHTSPFRHPQLQFRISCPIFVERQLFKHVIGISTNSRSGRYVDFSDNYYLIDNFRLQSKSSKQGSEGLLDEQKNKAAREVYQTIIDVAANGYKTLLGLGVCKEQARGILPLTLETEFIWTGSLQAFIHLCNLRLKPDAQLETREVVKLMLDKVRQSNKFKYSLEAYGHL